MTNKHGFHKQGLYMIHPRDNVGTALADLPAGDAAVFGAASLTVQLREAVAFGHKAALTGIDRGAEIIKYGYVIGLAAEDIPIGAAVGAGNCVSRIGVTQGEGVYKPGSRTQYTLAAYSHTKEAYHV